MRSLGRQSRHFDRRGADQPYVRLGTLRDMAAVARKLAFIRAAVQEIAKTEDVVIDPKSPKWVSAVRGMVDAAEKGKTWCEETVAILNEVKRKSETFLQTANLEFAKR